MELDIPVWAWQRVIQIRIATLDAVNSVLPLKNVVECTVCVCAGLTAQLTCPSNNHSQSAVAKAVVLQAAKSLCRMRPIA